MGSKPRWKIDARPLVEHVSPGACVGVSEPAGDVVARSYLMDPLRAITGECGHILASKSVKLRQPMRGRRFKARSTRIAPIGPVPSWAVGIARRHYRPARADYREQVVRHIAVMETLPSAVSTLLARCDALGDTPDAREIKAIFEPLQAMGLGAIPWNQLPPIARSLMRP